MIELISDLIMLIAIGVLSFGGFKCLNPIFWYDDNYWGVIVLSFVLTALIALSLSCIILLYSLSEIVALLAITPTEYLKFQCAVVILISNFSSVIISNHVKNKLVDYGLNKKMITKNESRRNLFGGR
ncbi:hypothetical protein [Methanococcus maripaludis]|uniref:Membrane protein implicated in regulation of membrane protease activity n=1 Tax=Methanococcus maripaludis TaxID=39152 RepID=A0A7J9PTQ4_METMI|nr:hypothetical protein [Methanococcus maripaludis]MBA2868921.1 hypothetical protein [Methanococcus maripaludis]